MGINDFIKVGTQIKEYRQKKGIKQKDIAKRLNIPVSTYANYENNHREPTSDVIEQIAEVLGTTPYDLLGAAYWDLKYNANNKLSTEVKLIEELGLCFGEKAVSLLKAFDSLNELGQNKALEYITDLTEQLKYKKESK